MGSMKAAVLDNWNESLTVRDVPEPEPGPGEVLVSIKACGVTRGVEHAVRGRYDDDPALTPRIPGHEFAGVIEGVGAGVSTLGPGDRILAYFYLVCGTCEWCLQGSWNRCENFDGWIGINRDGGYARSAVIPARNALPLPDDASFTAGAVATDGLATPLHICNRTGVDETDTVLIIGGAGRIGIHLSQLAASKGAQVLAADIQDERLDHIDRHTGPDVTPVDASEDDFTDRLESVSRNTGPTVIVDTVGDMDTLKDAWETIAMGGSVIFLPHLEKAPGIPIRDYILSEGALLGTRYATPSEVVHAAELLSNGRVNPVVQQRVDLEQLPAIHADFTSTTTHGMSILEP